MDHTKLSQLSDEELLRHADNVRDSLTTSDLEIELCRRLQEALDGDIEAEEEYAQNIESINKAIDALKNEIENLTSN